jgi:CRISPR-associated protein Csh1
MLALYDHIPSDLIAELTNQYGLDVSPKNQDLKLIILCFSLEGDNIQKVDSVLSDYDSHKNVSDYFYRGASGMSVSPFPTLYVTDSGLRLSQEYSKDSKDYGKIIRILKKNVQLNKELKPLLDFFINNPESIFAQLAKYIQPKAKSLFLLTISINGLCIGKSPYFAPIKDYVSKEFYENFYTLGGKNIVGKNQMCSMCLSVQPEIWGYVSIYNFYATKTEFAPIAGGFNKSLAHLNYPVCADCASKLEQMKPVINKFFNFKFCGFDYFLIPEVLSPQANVEAINAILDIMVYQYEHDSIHVLNSKTRIGGLTLSNKRKLLSQETREVFDMLSETENYASYTMLFYAKNNSEFKIQMTIENIFPEQFKLVFAAKELAEKHAIFHDLPGIVKDSIANLEFKFDTLREFLPLNDKIYGDYSKTFLEVVRCIFLQKQVSYSYLLQSMVSIIQRRFSREEYYEMTVRKSFLAIKFMAYLSIIPKPQNHFKEEKMNPKFAVFFTEHSEFFDTPAKQAVFMIGVLCQNLLNIQYRERNSTPFRKRLNSLKLDPLLVQKLYKEIIEKLEQYNKNHYYLELEQDIAKLIIKGGLCELSNDSISFIFALGLTLNKEFKTYNKNDDEDK